MSFTLELASAQVNTPLTLDDCIHLALSVPSNVSIARQESEIARRGVSVARSGFLPTFDVGNGYTYNSPLPGASIDPITGQQVQSFVALNGLREYSSQATASLEIDTSGRLRAAYARARADQQIANAQLQISQRDLKRQVTAAYYRLLLARRLVTASEDILMETSTFAKRTEQRFRGGEVAQADVFKAQAQLAFEQQALNAAQLDAQLANQELAAFWTANVDDRLRIEDTLEKLPPPPDAQAQQIAPPAYLRRFEFGLFEAQRRGFEADRRRERNMMFPQLTFHYQYGLDAPRLDWRYRGSAAFFTFNIPVFDFFRAHNLAEQFHIRSQQVEIEQALSTRTFSRDYANALARARFIFQQIEITRTQVNASTDNLRLARVRYEGGEGPALDVVAAVNQLAQARTNYSAALTNYANALADLEVASGR